MFRSLTSHDRQRRDTETEGAFSAGSDSWKLYITLCIILLIDCPVIIIETPTTSSVYLTAGSPATCDKSMKQYLNAAFVIFNKQT